MGTLGLLGMFALAQPVNPRRKQFKAVAHPKPPRNHGPTPKRRKGGKSHNTKRSR